MRILFCCAAAISAIVSASVVSAEEAAAPTPAASSVAPEFKRGTLVKTSDGKRIGRVDRVEDSYLSIIFGGRFVHIPTSTLTGSDSGLTSSLTYSEVRKLK